MSIHNYIETSSKFLIENLDKTLLFISLISLITLVIFIIISIKLYKISGRYNQLMEGVSGENLEEMLIEYISSVKRTRQDMEILNNDISQIKKELTFVISKVAAKRYNAFSDMGSDLSFTIAFLNKENSGVLITSIYGRDENRIYLKPVTKGNCDYSLSPEELQVMEEALG